MSAPPPPLPSPSPAPTLLGPPTNFWLHHPHHGFDLTHPSHPTSPPITPRLHLRTTTTPITIDPAKTALVIIDMQNFFLSPALGRAPDGPGHAACEALLTTAIPAARKAGIQIAWLNWGLTEEEVQEMPAAVVRAFGFESVPVGVDGEEGKGEGRTGRKIGTRTENGKDPRIYKGLGADMGPVTLPSSSSSHSPPNNGNHSSTTTTATQTETQTQTHTIEAGRLLMRHTWNAALYSPLQASYEQSLSTDRPDVWIHKNRMSGLWGATSPCTEYLERAGLRTLLFAGVNTDQCVAGSVQDAFAKGWDCVLVREACGTSSPAFATACVEFNCARSWGFVVGCGELERGVEEMVGRGGGEDG